MTTIYFTKRFDSGVLKGLTYATSISFSESETARYAKMFRTGRKRKEVITGTRYTIVDASFQNYQR